MLRRVVLLTEILYGSDSPVLLAFILEALAKKNNLSTIPYFAIINLHVTDKARLTQNSFFSLDPLFHI